MSAAVNRNPFILKQEEPTPAKGHLILPKPRKGETPPTQAQPLQQPFVPYSSNGYQPAGERSRPRPRPRYARPDSAMVAIAVSGLVGTLLAGVPAGIVMGPMALSRANRVEELVRTGERPPSDRGNVSVARVCAWISIAVSVPLVLFWLGIVVMLVGVLA